MAAPTPVVMKLPMAPDTIDRITKYRLSHTQPRWRWELTDTALRSNVHDLPPEAADAVVTARQEVFNVERTNVMRVLADVEAVGRLISEEAQEQ